jgi:hypothetical protein
VALFIPESSLVRVVFGLALCGLFVGAAFLVPLPKWQETPERLLVARKAMVVEAVAIAVIATGVALLIH